MTAGQVVRAALEIAAEIDIYTNNNLVVKELEIASP
jgi:ATP-dependent protease HslVU (ClpYQ) peptidase subunit